MSYLHQYAQAFKEHGIIIRCFTKFCCSTIDKLLAMGVTPLAIIDAAAHNLCFSDYKGIPIWGIDKLSNYENAYFFIANYAVSSIQDELIHAGIPENRIIQGMRIEFEECVKPANAKFAQERGYFDSQAYDEEMNKINKEIGFDEYSRCLPVYITVESSLLCNLNCIMCSYYKEGHKKTGASTKALYHAEDFDLLLTNARVITPQVGGEPMLDSLFWELIDRANELRSRAVIKFNTNGTCLTEKNTRRLVDALNNAEITVSIDAAEEDTHDIIRGVSLHQLLAQVKSLIEEKKKYGKNITIIIGMTVMRMNLEQMGDFVRIGAEVGADIVRVWPLNGKRGESRTHYIEKNEFLFYYWQQELSWYPKLTRAMADLARKTAAELGVNFSIYTPLLRQETIDDFMYPLDRSYFDSIAEKTPLLPSVELEDEQYPPICVAPWTSAIILKNGNVKPCCLMKESVGNFYTQPFKEIWNGEAIRAIRRGIIDGNLTVSCMESGCPFTTRQM